MFKFLIAALCICIASVDSRGSSGGSHGSGGKSAPAYNTGIDSMFGYSFWQHGYGDGYIIKSDKTSPSLFYPKN